MTAVVKPVARTLAPVPDVLDIGSIGAKAMGRQLVRVLTTPVFWLIVIVIAALLYFVLR